MVFLENLGAPKCVVAREQRQYFAPFGRKLKLVVRTRSYSTAFAMPFLLKVLYSLSFPSIIILVNGRCFASMKPSQSHITLPKSTATRHMFFNSSSPFLNPDTDILIGAKTLHLLL